MESQEGLEQPHSPRDAAPAHWDDEEEQDRHSPRQDVEPRSRRRTSPDRSPARSRDEDEEESASLLVRHLKFSTPPSAVRKFFEQCGEYTHVCDRRIYICVTDTYISIGFHCI